MDKQWDGEGMSEFPPARPSWPKTIRLTRVYELTFADEADFKKAVLDQHGIYTEPDENEPDDKLDSDGKLIEPDDGSYMLLRQDYVDMEGLDEFKLPIDSVDKYVQLAKYDLTQEFVSASDLFGEPSQETWEIV